MKIFVKSSASDKIYGPYAKTHRPKTSPGMQKARIASQYGSTQEVYECPGGTFSKQACKKVRRYEDGRATYRGSGEWAGLGAIAPSTKLGTRVRLDLFNYGPTDQRTFRWLYPDAPPEGTHGVVRASGKKVRVAWEDGTETVVPNIDLDYAKTTGIGGLGFTSRSVPVGVRVCLRDDKSLCGEIVENRPTNIRVKLDKGPTLWYERGEAIPESVGLLGLGDGFGGSLTAIAAFFAVGAGLVWLLDKLKGPITPITLTPADIAIRVQAQ